MKGIKIIGVGEAEIRDVPVPKLRPDYILIKVEAVALNPSDWKALHKFPIQGATVGNDLAGTVIEVGPEVTASVKPGDRVAALANGSNSEHLDQGAFGEYAVVKGDIAIKIPEWMSFEEGCTLGVATCTIALAVYQKLGLALPDEPTTVPEWVFVHAGSSAMGTFAIQMLKLSGFKVVTTCSPSNFELVKSYGADVAFDYNSPTCAEDIRKITENKLYYAFAILADNQSAQLCADALSTDTATRQPICSGFYVNEPETSRDDVRIEASFAYTVTGEVKILGDIRLGPIPEDFEFGKKAIRVVNELLKNKKIRAHPIDVRPGGLASIPQGLEDLRQGRVSGKKIVVPLADTT